MQTSFKRALAGVAARTVALAAIMASVATPSLSAHAAPWSPAQAGSTLTATSAGREFWLAFPVTTGFPPALTSSASLSVRITGAEAATGTVEVPGQSWSQSFTVTPGTVTTVELPTSFVVPSTNGVSQIGVHVSATADIAVTRLSYGSQGWPAGSTVLPLGTLGQRYRVLTYGNASTSGTTSRVTVVASVDDTEVTITPGLSGETFTAGAPYTVTLEQGEVFQLTSENDLTGSIVESTKPVAAFSGGTCINVPAGVANCGAMVQQLPPTSAWGTDFVSVRLATRTKGDTYRVLANEDDTVISVNGSVVATIDAGDKWESVLPAGATSAGSDGVHIHTSAPALVAQFGNGSSYDGVTKSGALMMFVPPTEQYLDAFTFGVPSIVRYSPYLNLVVPTDDVGAVLLDGDAVGAGSFQAIGDSGYSGAQLAVTAGAHTLAGPNPLSAQVYEWRVGYGFGFSVGMDLSRIYVDPDDPLNLSSEAAAPTAQHAAVPIPDGGSLSLLDDSGDAVTEIVDSGVGTFTLDTDTITFTPVLGYVGTADMADFQITGTGYTSPGTYTPTVTLPAAPTATDLTSSGPANQPQHVTVTLAADTSVALLDTTGDPATEVVDPGVGTYTLDTDRITFTPALDYTGTPTGITYQVADAYSQTTKATYTPTVNAPPVAVRLTSSGTATDPQQVMVSIPVGGTATLLDSTGDPVSAIVDSGVGTYTLDTDTITFTPVLGYVGTPTGITYQLIDAEGQASTNTYTPTVTLPAAPTATDLTSSGPANQPQHVTVTLAANTTVALLDTTGDPATEVVDPGVGTYTLDTDRITFTPALDYTGTPTAITYQVADAYSQTTNATYTPTIDAPPVAVRLTSSGTATARQQVMVNIPVGGTATLLDSTGDPVSAIVDSGVGTYTLDTDTITFMPMLGYAGTPTGITYQLTDAEGQASINTYTPSVILPSPPTATDLTSSGPANQPQHVTVTLAANTSVALLDTTGGPATEVVDSGVGTYTLDTDTITFTPALGYTGTPTAITYQVADAYSQTTNGTYTPTFEADVAAPPTLELRARTVSWLNTLRPDSVPTRCIVANSEAKVCRVVLTARVHGRRTAIGFGITRLDRARTGPIKVPVYLNQRGLAVAARAHGVTATAHGELRALGTRTWLRGTDRTQIITAELRRFGTLAWPMLGFLVDLMPAI
jgi:CshA-type fibril repeat protein